jgi:hypothetical protein
MPKVQTVPRDDARSAPRAVVLGVHDRVSVSAAACRTARAWPRSSVHVAVEVEVVAGEVGEDRHRKARPCTRFRTSEWEDTSITA